MKKLIIAVALVVASAAPVMAEGFPNSGIRRYLGKSASFQRKTNQPTRPESIDPSSTLRG